MNRLLNKINEEPKVTQQFKCLHTLKYDANPNDHHFLKTFKKGWTIDKLLRQMLGWGPYYIAVATEILQGNCEANTDLDEIIVKLHDGDFCVKCEGRKLKASVDKEIVDI